MKHRLRLDPGFVPAVLWNRACAAKATNPRLEADGDPRARAISETIGTCFGYAVPRYMGFYEILNLLILGRVTSGEGGEVILEKAAAVLRDEFPELAIRLRTPDEKDKRRGQAVAAASLPKLQ